MGLVEYLLIAVGVIAVAFLMVTVVRRISAYYRQRHNMSVWAGVFMLAVSVVLVVFAVYHYETPNTLLIIIAGALLLLTAFLDIHHAGVGMGLLALLFQIVLAAAFIAVIVVAVILYVIRAVRRGDDMVMDALTGTTSGFRNGVSLFFRFFMP
jgi:hypothetical protein